MKLTLLFIAILAGIGWLRLMFLNGYIPGIYPIVELYSQLLIFPTLLFIVFLPVLIPTFFVLLLQSLWVRLQQRRFKSETVARILLIPLLIVALIPVLFSCAHLDSLMVQPWDKAYHIGYYALATDDNYGEVLIFECDRTGFLCKRVDQINSDITTKDNLKLSYDPPEDRLTINYDDDVVYTRLQKESIDSIM